MGISSHILSPSLPLPSGLHGRGHYHRIASTPTRLSSYMTLSHHIAGTYRLPPIGQFSHNVNFDTTSSYISQEASSKEIGLTIQSEQMEPLREVTKSKIATKPEGTSPRSPKPTTASLQSSGYLGCFQFKCFHCSYFSYSCAA